MKKNPNKFTLRYKLADKFAMFACTAIMLGGTFFVVDALIKDGTDKGLFWVLMRLLLILVFLLMLWAVVCVASEIWFQRINVDGTHIYGRINIRKKFDIDASEIRKITYSINRSSKHTTIKFKIKTSDDELELDHILKNFKLMADHLIGWHATGVIPKKAISPYAMKHLALYASKDVKPDTEALYPSTIEDLYIYMKGLDLKGEVSLVNIHTSKGTTVPTIVWQIAEHICLQLEIIDNEIYISGHKSGNAEDLLEEPLFISELEELPDDLQKFNRGYYMYLEKGRRGQFLEREEYENNRGKYEGWDILLG